MRLPYTMIAFALFVLSFVASPVGYPYGQPPQRIRSRRLQGFRNPAMALWNALGERIPKPCSDIFSLSVTLLVGDSWVSAM